ncbi:MAG TPA: ROK family transcriptional regulator [Anaerolineales bacterium]
MEQNATSGLIRRLNRSAILDLIRESGPISRSTIGRKLNISLPTVMRIISELDEEGLVRDCGSMEASGGRPRSLVEFNGGGSVVIGIDLGGTKMFGTVADLSGNIQVEEYITWNGDQANSLNRVCDLVERLLAAPRPDGQSIRGIGIGAPGITLYEEGVVSWAPGLGWRDLPLKKILVERYGLPVVIENDVNLAALGEYGFGAGKGASSLVCMAVGTGIGAGIVIDRKVYRGFHQSAGEIGYLPPDVSYLGRSYSGFGAFESIASGPGIAARARQLLQDRGLPLPHEGLTSEAVFNAARGGEVWAQQVLNDTVDYLAFAVATITALIDPEVIVLGGGVARSADLLIDPILRRVKGVVPSLPLLVQSTLGFRAAVMGAIMLVLDATTEHVAIGRLI